jgi:hypothetical protein
MKLKHSIHNVYGKQNTCVICRFYAIQTKYTPLVPIYAINTGFRDYISKIHHKGRSKTAENTTSCIGFAPFININAI